MIMSENYNEGSAGFRLKYDGDAEFNNGTFRGELQARHISITGQVTSGTDYLLKANYEEIIASYDPETNNPGVIGLTKALTTAARGSCAIVLTFKGLSNGRPNAGGFKITVNGNTVAEWQNLWGVIGGSYSAGLVAGGNRTITIPDVSLPNNLNQVILYFAGSAPVSGTFAVASRLCNSGFELRCNEDPGLLSLLG